jgi:hypothetical protein
MTLGRTAVMARREQQPDEQDADYQQRFDQMAAEIEFADSIA